MDKHTLELAAKAAGYKFRVSNEWHCAGQAEIEITLPSGWKDYKKWTPLADWNDAALLAEAIGATVDFKRNVVFVEMQCGGIEFEPSSFHNNSIQRALVALAARIGEAME